MATLILRPSSDSSLNHSCSSGSSGYLMISESTADDDSTYIYQAVSSTSSATKTSTFNLSGTMPSGSFKITGATLYVRAKTSSTSGTYSGTYKLSTDSSSVSLSLDTSYSTSSTTSTASNLIGNTYTSTNFPELTVTISTSGNKSSNKGSSFNICITQAYLELEYEEVIIDTKKIYIKENGQWTEYGTVYKKVSGSWVLQSDITSVFDTNTNYVKGN